MKANPRYPHFRELLETPGSDWLVPWEGDCWRLQSVKFPKPVQILNGKGALRSGGRWNAPGAFAVVYGCTDDVTAAKESSAAANYYNFPMREPRILVAIHFKLQGVLNLTDASIRRRLGVTLSEIRAEDWRKLQELGSESLSQCLGRAAFWLGAEGIIIPSFARPRGVNIAFFPGNRAAGSSAKVWHEDELRKMLQTPAS